VPRPREEDASADTGARREHANLEPQAANNAESSTEVAVDAQGGSPPVSFSPRRVGSEQDAGAQQQ
jgi:hypothetical protein